MNWFTRVRNSITSLSKRSTEKDLWVKCPSCQQMVFAQEYEDNSYVCPRCGHHGRIGADERLRQLLDEGFDVLPIPDVKEDPLKFRDTSKYTDRLKKARAKSPHKDAFLVGSGAIEGKPAVVGVQDFGFMGGSMGMAVGNAMIAGAERAVKRRAPFVVFAAAGGAPQAVRRAGRAAAVVKGRVVDAVVHRSACGQEAANRSPPARGRNFSSPNSDVEWRSGWRHA